MRICLERFALGRARFLVNRRRTAIAFRDALPEGANRCACHCNSGGRGA